MKCSDWAQNPSKAKRPHMVIAFLYNRYLGWMPARIAKELGSLLLADLPGLLTAEVESQFPTLKGFGRLPRCARI